MVTYNLSHDPVTGMLSGTAHAVTSDSSCLASLTVRDAATAALRIGVCGPERVVMVNAVRIEHAGQWLELYQGARK